MNISSVRKFLSWHVFGGKVADKKFKKTLKKLQSQSADHATAVPGRLYQAWINMKEAQDPEMRDLYGDIYDAELNLWDAQKAAARALGVPAIQIALNAPKIKGY